VAKLRRGWQVLAVALAVWWAGYLAFDLMPAVLIDDGRIYLINARFLGEAVPRCLASEDRLGCLGLLVTRLNTIEVYCRAITVLISGAATWRLHLRLRRHYTRLAVL
jgi:hypothetical protein